MATEFIPDPPEPPQPPLPHPDRKKPGVQGDIADADKLARTGSTDETVRNAPPDHEWSDMHPTGTSRRYKPTG